MSCDYLIVNCSDDCAYFIELKGSDVFKAYQQIENTLNRVKVNLNSFSCFARIVPTKVVVPNIQNDPKTIRLRKLFSSFNGNIVIKEINLIETV